ncbi:putative signal transducing protein [Hydrogenophaga sp.]|uniref:putative signal transducing protein n=1 Tax=Hydrogenophaga sp. TaxID=1904254 RepID=UPI002FCBBB5D
MNDEGNSPYNPALGDWQTLITVFSPTEAYLLRGVLQAAGVPAAVADAHLVQAYTLLAGAIPVRVQVPEHRRAQAEAVLAAFERGDYGLRDDHFGEETPP